MSREVVKLAEQEKLPWLRLAHGRLAESSKTAIDELFLRLGGRIFFTHVEPMKSRAKYPRRGFGEFVSEVVAFAQRADGLAATCQGEKAVENLATEIRKISGFGGKGALGSKIPPPCFAWMGRIRILPCFQDFA